MRPLAIILLLTATTASLTEALRIPANRDSSGIFSRTNEEPLARVKRWRFWPFSSNDDEEEALRTTTTTERVPMESASIVGNEEEENDRFWSGFNPFSGISKLVRKGYRKLKNSTIGRRIRNSTIGRGYRRGKNATKRGLVYVGNAIRAGYRKIKRKLTGEQKYRHFVDRVRDGIEKGDNRTLEMLNKLGINVTYDESGIAHTNVRNDSSTITEILANEGMINNITTTVAPILTTTAESIISAPTDNLMNVSSTTEKTDIDSVPEIDIDFIVAECSNENHSPDIDPECIPTISTPDDDIVKPHIVDDSNETWTLATEILSSTISVPMAEDSNETLPNSIGPLDYTTTASNMMTYTTSNSSVEYDYSTTAFSSNLASTTTTSTPPDDSFEIPSFEDSSLPLDFTTNPSISEMYSTTTEQHLEIVTNISTSVDLTSITTTTESFISTPTENKISVSTTTDHSDIGSESEIDNDFVTDKCSIESDGTIMDTGCLPTISASDNDILEPNFENGLYETSSVSTEIASSTISQPMSGDSNVTPTGPLDYTSTSSLVNPATSTASVVYDSSTASLTTEHFSTTSTPTSTVLIDEGETPKVLPDINEIATVVPELPATSESIYTTEAPSHDINTATSISVSGVVPSTTQTSTTTIFPSTVKSTTGYSIASTSAAPKISSEMTVGDGTTETIYIEPTAHDNLDSTVTNSASDSSEVDSNADSIEDSFPSIGGGGSDYDFPSPFGSPDEPMGDDEFPDVFGDNVVRDRLREIYERGDFSHDDLRAAFNFDPEDYHYYYDYENAY